MQLEEVDELLSGVGGKGRGNEAEDEDDPAKWTKITSKRSKRRVAGGTKEKDASERTATDESSGYDENGSPPLSEGRGNNGARGSDFEN